MTIGDLFWHFDPSREMRDILTVRNECEGRHANLFETQQQCACLGYSKSISSSLREYAHESEFCNRATGQLRRTGLYYRATRTWNS